MLNVRNTITVVNLPKTEKGLADDIIQDLLVCVYI